MRRPRSPDARRRESFAIDRSLMSGENLQQIQLGGRALPRGKDRDCLARPSSTAREDLMDVAPECEVNDRSDFTGDCDPVLEHGAHRAQAELGKLG